MTYLGSLSQDLITDTTGAEQAWVIFGETWIPSATCLPSDRGESAGAQPKGVKQLEKPAQDNHCSWHKHRAAWAATTHTSLSNAEEAFPLAKCLVLHRSCTILFLNGSSIFQQEIAEPTAGSA